MTWAALVIAGLALGVAVGSLLRVRSTVARLERTEHGHVVLPLPTGNLSEADIARLWERIRTEIAHEQRRGGVMGTSHPG